MDGALYETSGINSFIDDILEKYTPKRGLDIGITNFLDGKNT
jgi:hypothetical protein